MIINPAPAIAAVLTKFLLDKLPPDDALLFFTGGIVLIYTKFTVKLQDDHQLGGF